MRLVTLVYGKAARSEEEGNYQAKMGLEGKPLTASNAERDEDIKRQERRWRK